MLKIEVEEVIWPDLVADSPGSQTAAADGPCVRHIKPG